MSPRNAIAAVIGAGPGLGAALSHRFAREGYTVALMSRSLDSLTALQTSIEAAGGRALSIPVDLTSADSIRQGFASLPSELPVDVLLYNPAPPFSPKPFLETTEAELEHNLAVACIGASHAARAVLPGMLERGHGTIIFSGATAALRGSSGFAAYAPSKFAARALSQSLAREFGPRGIHVAHVVLDGLIGTPRVRAWFPNKATTEMLDVDAVAEEYWRLCSQNPTTWTWELELRPSAEKF